MEEADQEYVDVFRTEAGSWDIAVVQDLARRMEANAGAGSLGKENFVIDNSTPHGDVIITESSAMKPGVGWATVHSTESLKTGVHEWSVRIENQGETSDGSGLMLGVVPKSFSRYDSFISQGGGWCLSRAGKFYGHWRRIDTNTSVSSLVFGTGDSVVFELDVDSAKMTVRVGDKFVIGELSNLSGEVLPAISLHYRHQHVRFEYYKLRDRNARKTNWIERNALPAASVMLRIVPRLVTFVPIDSAAVNPHGCQNLGKVLSYPHTFPGEKTMLSTISVTARAYRSVQSYVHSGLVKLDKRLTDSVTPETLRVGVRSTPTGDPGNPFSGEFGALLYVHLFSHLATKDDTSALLLSAGASLENFVHQLPPFGLREENGMISSVVLDDVEWKLSTIIREQSGKKKEVSNLVLETALSLFASIALQRGRLADIVQCCRYLINHGTEPPKSTLVNFCDKLLASCDTSQNFLMKISNDVYVGATSPSQELIVCNADSLLSVATDGFFLFGHSKAFGLTKHGTGGGGTARRQYCSIRTPEEYILSCTYSSMGILAESLVVHTSAISTTSIFAIVYTKDFLQVRVVRSTDMSSFPTATGLKLFSTESSLYAVCWKEDGGDISCPISPPETFATATKAQRAVSLVKLSQGFEVDTELPLTHSLPVLAQTALERSCLSMERDIIVDFGPLNEFLAVSNGHFTVEFWMKWEGKDESKVLYQHGDKMTGGEVFIETFVVEDVLGLRAGSRRPSATCAVTSPLPVRSIPQWTHVALVFDGRWKLFIDFALVGTTATSSPQHPVENPRGRRLCAVGCQGKMAELRFWAGGRSQQEIQRHARRSCSGSETGLMLYCPMQEPEGQVIYDYSPHHSHGWITKTRRVCRDRISDHPVTMYEKYSAASEVARSAIIGAWNPRVGVFSNGRAVTFLVPNALEDTTNSRSSCGLIAASFAIDDGQSLSQDIFLGNCFHPVAACSISSHNLFFLSSNGPFIQIKVPTYEGKRGKIPENDGTPAGLAVKILSSCCETCEMLVNERVLFRPLATDIQAAFFESILALAKDHFRSVQSSSARRTSLWREEYSVKIVEFCLRLLLHNIEVFRRTNLCSTTVSLAVPPDGDEVTVGTRLETFLCAIIDDPVSAPSCDSSYLQELASSILKRAVPLFYQGTQERLRFAASMLPKKPDARSSQMIKLLGLVESCSSISDIVTIANVNCEDGPSASLSQFAYLLLDECYKETISAIATTKFSGDPARLLFHFTKELSSVQFVLLSGACDNTISNTIPTLPISNLFEPHGEQEPAGVLSFFSALVQKAIDIINELAHSQLTANILLEILERSFVGSVLQHALCGIPMACRPGTANSFLSLADNLFVAINDLVGVVGLDSRGELDHCDTSGQRVLISLNYTVASAMSWIAVYMSYIAQQGSVEVAPPEVKKLLEDQLLVAGIRCDGESENAEEDCALQLLEENSWYKTLLRTPVDTVGGPAVHACFTAFVVATAHVGSHDSQWLSSQEATRMLEKSFDHCRPYKAKLMFLKGEQDGEARLKEIRERCVFLLQFRKAFSLSVSPATLLSHISDEGTYSNKWHEAFRRWRGVRKLTRLAEATNNKILEKVAEFVFEFAQGKISSDDVAKVSKKSQQLAEARVRGLDLISRTVLTGSTSNHAVETIGAFVRGMCGRGKHYMDNLLGCSKSTAESIQSLVYSIVKAHITSRSSNADDDFLMTVGLLDCRWESYDYSFLDQLGVPSILFKSCSIFDESGALHQESATEKMRRTAYKEKVKRPADSSARDGSKAYVRTKEEEAVFRSWDVLAFLTYRAIELGCRKDVPTNFVDSKGCQRFLTSTLAVLQEEVKNCIEHIARHANPVADRVLDHLSALSSFLCNIIHSFPPCYHAVISSCTTVGKLLALFAELTLEPFPSSPLHLGETGILLLSHYFPRTMPMDLSPYFNKFVDDSSLGPSNCGSAVKFLLKLSIGFGTTSTTEPLTANIARTSVKTLRYLLIHCPKWNAEITAVCQELLSHVDNFVAGERNQEDRRESGLRLLAGMVVICGFVSDIPRIGEKMCCLADPELNYFQQVLLVEISSQNGGTATAVDATLENFFDDKEVPVENLFSSDEDLPPPETVTKLFPSIFSALDALLSNFMVTSSTVIGCCIVAVACKFLTRCANYPEHCVEIRDSGILKKLSTTFCAQLPVSPLPLSLLEEQSAVVLCQHMKSVKPSDDGTGIPAPSIASVAVVEHHKEPLEEDLKQNDPVKPRAASSVPDFHLMFCDPTGMIVFSGNPSSSGTHPFPSGDGGLTLEAVVYLRDAAKLYIGGSHTSPTHWGKPGQLHHRLVGVYDGSGQCVVSLTINNDAILFGSPITGVFAAATLHKKDFGRWIHIAAIYDGRWYVYKEGDLVAIKSDQSPIITASECALTTMECGGSSEGERSRTDTVVEMSSLRLWGHPIQKSLVKSIADIVSSENVLPPFSLVESNSVTFRFSEGTGEFTYSEDQLFRGKLHGNVKWCPAPLPTVVNDTETRSIDADKDPMDVELTVPRREWQAQLSALDASNVALLGCQCFSSLCAHYSRRLVFNVIEALQKPELEVVQDRLRKEILTVELIQGWERSPHLLARACSNIIRFHPRSSSYHDAEVFSNYLCKLLSNFEQEEQSRLFKGFVKELFEELNNCVDHFPVEMPYHSFLASEPPVHLMMIGGNSQCSLVFDSSRAMDYLYVFGDKSQKVSIAKFPDSQGVWPEFELSPMTWYYLKPSSSSRAIPARFVIRAKSEKFFHVLNMLNFMLEYASKKNEHLLQCLLNAQSARTLTSIAHTETSERRIATVRTLGHFIRHWALHSLVSPFDQMPLCLVLNPLIAYGELQARREQQLGIVYASPTRVHSKVVQNILELYVEGHITEEKWRGRSFMQAAVSRWESLQLLYAEGYSNPSCAWDENQLELQDVCGSGSGSFYSRKGEGTWIVTCDRGWHTVRSCVGVSRGRWYFEVRIPQPTSSVCVGYVTDLFQPMETTHFTPIGQCANSWAFDGSRLCRWHNGIRHEFSNRAKWKARDVIGILIDLEEGSLSCMHNGKLLNVAYENMTNAKSRSSRTYFPTISFNPSGCEINFGAAHFVQDIPSGFLPYDRLAFFVGGVLPIKNCMALVEICSAHSTTNALPPFFRGLDVEKYSEVPGRRGFEVVSIVVLDGKPKVEDKIVRAGTSMATVKGNVSVTEGKWFYEVVIQGDGLVQIGWSTAGFVADSVRGKGIGDDNYSWSIDGCRMLARHNRQQRSLGRQAWREGDVVGCYLDCDEGVITFMLNGQPLRDLHETSGTKGLFVGIDCSQGMVPTATLDQDNALAINFTDANMCFPQPDYRSLGTADPFHGKILKYYCGQVPGEPLTATFTTAKAAKIANAVGFLAETQSDSCFNWEQLIRSHSTSLLHLSTGEAPETLYSTVVLLHRISSLFSFLLPLIPILGAQTYCDCVNGPLARCAKYLHPFLLGVFTQDYFTKACTATNTLGEPIKLTINRRKATVASVFQSSVFGQIFSLIGSKPSHIFCTSKKLWSVVFAGEGADDVGGPYRESLAAICTELMSPALPLFIPSPNQSGNTGECRDKFIPNPHIPEGIPAHQMFFFLGKVMGGCLRSGEPLALQLPSSVWKAIVGEAITEDDLELVDLNCFQSIKFFRSCDDDLMEDEELQEAYNNGFVAHASDGKEVELFPGGKQYPLTVRFASVFASLLSEYRTKEESLSFIRALCRGFHKVVPLHFACLLRWEELERMVCGRPDFSVDDLKASVRYDGLTPEDQRVRFLWQILSDFTQQERALFTRFVSGRVRLPPSVRLKLMPSIVPEGEDDQHLPGASTCFFWLSLPDYSTIEVMRAKLVYAIHHCVEIDADFRVQEGTEDMAPQVVVTEEDDEGEFEDYSHLL